MKKVYDYSLADIKAKIGAHDLKCTSQRLSIYNLLLSLDHPVVEEVYDAIKPGNPSISLSTVYNTLETFVKHELVWKIKIPTGKMRYDVRQETHFHLFDEKTTKVIDYFDEELMSIISSHLAKKNLVAKGNNGIHLIINQ